MNSLIHRFLVACPTLNDPNFEQSVIYIYEHSEEGAMGLVINKKLKMKLDDVLQHLSLKTPYKFIAEQPVMMGGPVGQEHGFVLYSGDVMTDESEQEIFISSSKEMLMNIANNEGPDHYLITLGYSGWEPGQIEIEIERNDWIVVPFDAKILFSTPIEQRWRETAKLIGLDFDHLSTLVGHA